MHRLEVFDPPQCCSTGVCGPSVDPKLVTFAADLHWLANQSVAVERYNLSQQPMAFTSNPVVKSALAQSGTACLPLIVLDGMIVSRGEYPARRQLANLVGVAVPEAPVHSGFRLNVLQ